MKKHSNFNRKSSARKPISTDEQLRQAHQPSGNAGKQNEVPSQKNLPLDHVSEKKTTYSGKQSIINYLTNQDPW